MQKDEKVKEVPGLYGTFAMEERMIQQIWNENSILPQNLKTIDDIHLQILKPGKWNLAEEGPDFKDASISLDGKVIHGDIEIHFEEKDWWAHGHEQDPAYKKVILHVILFPPKGKKAALKKGGGNPLPTFFLLPYLPCGLEEYAENLAIEKLSGIKPDQAEIPTSLPSDWKQARNWARERWLAKCKYAEGRLHSTDWERACHQWFLEVLGYRRNRVPMARIAQRFPLQIWQKGINPFEAFQTEKDWKLRGVRPANHPQKRLEQYAQLIKKRPDWPERLQRMNLSMVHDGANAPLRKDLPIKELESEWAQQILGDTFGGTRINTLMVDAAMPLWSAKHGDAFTTWFHWSVGDVPTAHRKWAKVAGLSTRKQPFSNGIAQAILHGLLLE